MKITYFSDPSHGWYSVKKSVIDSLGVSISSCSYQKNDTVYLEEDSDASIVFKKMNELGIIYTIVRSKTICNTRHKIRSYDSYF